MVVQVLGQGWQIFGGVGDYGQEVRYGGKIQDLGWVGVKFLRFWVQF